MNKYYIKSEDGTSYIEVPKTNIITLLEQSIRSKYVADCYANTIAFEELPEEYREEVRTQVENLIEKQGRYDEQPIPPYELKVIVENLPKTKLTRESAKILLTDIDSLRIGATDEVASIAVSVYPHLKEDGSLVKAGTRINWNGIVKRAAVDLWDTAENNPDNAPTLWEDIGYREGYRIIPETITTGTLFAKDECGWWDDTLYVSLIDNNVWNPIQYPAGWSIFEEN